MNEQLEAKVLTRSSNSSKTSYAVAADLSEMEIKKILIEKMESNKSIHRSDEKRNLYKALTSYVVAADLSEMELKKILIKKMEGNKSIHRSDEQRNLYKAQVEAYESDKIILDTYRDIVTLKRRCDDEADKDEEPSVGSDWGSKRRREGNEPESTSAPKEKATRTTGNSTQRVKVSTLSQFIRKAEKSTCTLCLLKYALRRRHNYDITVFFTKRVVTEEHGLGKPKLDKLEEVQFDLQPSEVGNRCFLVRNWLLRLVTHTLVTQFGSSALIGAGVEDRVGAEYWFFLSSSNALTISLSSATSDEIDGVEELEFTLATTALAHA
nr:hypothetical protein [Tanacetum cinerariifolium]